MNYYNGQNIDFTGDKNPYGLIQTAGKTRLRKSRKSRKSRGKKTRKYRVRK
jgi:hypothetical protein